MSKIAELSWAAKIFAKKYASVDAMELGEQVKTSVQTAIANASSVKSSGIMPFMNMLKETGGTISMNITRNGNDVLVSAPTHSFGSEAPKYAALPLQVQNYLEKNLEVFPTKVNGEPVNYNNYTFEVSFNQPIPMANK